MSSPRSSSSAPANEPRPSVRPEVGHPRSRRHARRPRCMSERLRPPTTRSEKRHSRGWSAEGCSRGNARFGGPGAGARDRRPRQPGQQAGLRSARHLRRGRRSPRRLHARARHPRERGPARRSLKRRCSHECVQARERPLDETASIGHPSARRPHSPARSVATTRALRGIPEHDRPWIFFQRFVLRLWRPPRVARADEPHLLRGDARPPLRRSGSTRRRRRRSSLSPRPSSSRADSRARPARQGFPDGPFDVYPTRLLREGRRASDRSTSPRPYAYGGQSRPAWPRVSA